MYIYNDYIIIIIYICLLIGAMASVLSKDLEGVLKALQVIYLSIDGITAFNPSVPSVLPFLVRATLNTVATQIENLTTAHMDDSGRRKFPFFSATAAGMPLVAALQADMQQLTLQSMNIQSAAELVISQPRLTFVQGLLRQGQELLITHALNWKLAIASRVISTLSHLHSLGQRFENIGPVIRDFVTSGDGTMYMYPLSWSRI